MLGDGGHASDLNDFAQSAAGVMLVHVHHAASQLNELAPIVVTGGVDRHQVQHVVNLGKVCARYAGMPGFLQPVNVAVYRSAADAELSGDVSHRAADGAKSGNGAATLHQTSELL